jgi:hypothetical protein
METGQISKNIQNLHLFEICDKFTGNRPCKQSFTIRNL